MSTEGYQPKPDYRATLAAELEKLAENVRKRNIENATVEVGGVIADIRKIDDQYIVNIEGRTYVITVRDDMLVSDDVTAGTDDSDDTQKSTRLSLLAKEAVRQHLNDDTSA